jgi:serine/threonine-protein kinase HipA
MSDRELWININEHRVGTLRESNDLWAFEYTQDWVTSPTSFDLSPVLKRQQQPHADGASGRPW